MQSKFRQRLDGCSSFVRVVRNTAVTVRLPRWPFSRPKQVCDAKGRNWSILLFCTLLHEIFMTLKLNQI